MAVRLARRRPPAGALPAGVCAAPFSSMYLDQHGSVRACCQNTEHPLGNVRDASLREIWESGAARTLRQAMLEHDLELGCNFCKWQVEEGNDGLVFARTFDHLRPDSTAPMWPKQLELSISNACNLQCAMCNGDWSSSIRTHREGRPPLPQVYDEQFYEDLRPFLEHVEVVKILGGEPFLGKEPLRVMEMMVEMGCTAEVHVTTNGTQWSPRIERILEKLPMVIVVSFDGSTKEVYEGIRIGADFDTVVRNIDRFRHYADAHGTAVNLAHCLMTSNWQHFPDLLRFAEERRLRTYVNTVTYPTSLSMFHLSVGKLQRVVDAFRAVDAEMRAELELNRQLWVDQLERLEHRLAGLTEGKGVDYYLGVQGFSLIDRDAPRGEAARAAAEVPDGGEPTLVRADLDLVVTGVGPGPEDVAGVPVAPLVGQNLEVLLGQLTERYGAPDLRSPALPPPDVRTFSLVFAGPGAPAISAFLSPARDDDGVIEEFEIRFVVVVAQEGVEPAPDAAEAEFRARHPEHHVVDIDPEGIVLRVDPVPSVVGTALAGGVGRPSDDLLASVADALGEVVDLSAGPPVPDAEGYVARFRAGDGQEVAVEAVVVARSEPGSTRSGTRLLIAEVPA